MRDVARNRIESRLRWETQRNRDLGFHFSIFSYFSCPPGQTTWNIKVSLKIVSYRWKYPREYPLVVDNGSDIFFIDLYVPANLAKKVLSLWFPFSLERMTTIPKWVSMSSKQLSTLHSPETARHNLCLSFSLPVGVTAICQSQSAVLSAMKLTNLTAFNSVKMVLGSI